MDRSNFAVELYQHRNNTAAVPGFPSPNPIMRPFDTEPDSEPDLASPMTFSDELELVPETYTYTAKRYTFTYTMVRRVRVRVRVRVRGVADQSDHCLRP